MTRFTHLLAAAVLLAAAGCGGSNAVPVSGTVTRGGKPLSAAIIAFEPKAGSGTTGAGAGGDIRDGAFAIPAAKNLSPGTYVVRVSPVTIGSGDDLKTAPPQFTPWETTVELKAGGEPLALDVPAKD